ncbi:hypothetical protein DSM104443_03466 [Usitatibacter rugosus]|uniref:Glycosyltransferase RgtA/B/C/D-like domain-containing protein n=1 Tax=Usitatibacter rugosus TaxID=2732067 RepID=A0A6M4GYP7_9PROT|nr:hypothetical protein [Usitatibacter rugosus]QJR12380.1 hypothetical protein DSM104443_03466 [Usitatibacter rugosus]
MNDRRAALASWLGFALAAAWLMAPVLRVYFLSDDFVPLALFHHWQEQGRFGAMLLAKLHTGLDAGDNHFYRPLSYASFALNYVVGGLDARGWMAVNLALHVASAVMAGTIGVRLVGARGAQASLAAALGAVLFLAFAPSAEVAAWISGRFDASATFFTLLSCLLFLASRRLGDAASVASLVAAVAAFLCKESAAILPFAILLLAAARDEEEGASWTFARFVAAVRRSLPWLIVAAAYLVARYVFFGSFTRVYAGTTPATAILTLDYWSGLAGTLPIWFAAHFRPEGHATAVLGFTAIQLALVAWVVFSRGTSRAMRTALLALVAAAAFTIALVAPHIGRLPPMDLGGRLLYQTAGFYAALVAAAIAVANPVKPLAVITVGVALIHGSSLLESLDRRVETSDQMRALIGEIARESAATRAGDYTLVLAPRDYKDIPFAINAQGGLMLPPVFPAPLGNHLLVQIYEEIPELPGKIEGGVVTTLRQHSVFEYLEGKRVKAAEPEYPTRVVCWDPKLKQLVPVPVTPGPAPKPWAEAIGRYVAGSGCAFGASIGRPR